MVATCKDSRTLLRGVERRETGGDSGTMLSLRKYREKAEDLTQVISYKKSALPEKLAGVDWTERLRWQLLSFNIMISLAGLYTLLTHSIYISLATKAIVSA